MKTPSAILLIFILIVGLSALILKVDGLQVASEVTLSSAITFGTISALFWFCYIGIRLLV